MIPDIAAKSGIVASDIPILNGSKRANKHFSGTFWQRDTGTGWQRCLQVAGQIETPHPPDPMMRRPCADREEKRVTHGNGLRQEERLDPSNPNQRGL